MLKYGILSKEVIAAHENGDMPMMFRYLIVPLALWFFAGLQYFWVAPLLERLPAGYAEETSFDATSSFRERPSDPFGASNHLIARRVDQTLVNSAEHSIIQGDTHWTNDGVVEFESTGIYGVDRYTRENIQGFGDKVRTGAFLFPPHIARKNFDFWDPMYIGTRHATFERTEMLDGLEIFVFRFSVEGLDETDGYSHLPDVPERYFAHSDGVGTLWIEPASGILVDFSDVGVSYFVEPTTGSRVADLYHWESKYTPQTKDFKINQAKAERLRIKVLEIWLPLLLVIIGLLVMGWNTNTAIKNRDRNLDRNRDGNHARNLVGSTEAEGRV
jgi:hypothetical protein